MQSVSHAVPDTSGEAFIEKLGAPELNAYDALVAQPLEQLRQHEGAPAGTLDEIEEGVVRLGLHELERELLDRRLVERTQHDPLGAVVLETRERAEEPD